MDEINLQNILDGFNAPLNEEQAWAVCFQCANYLKDQWDENNSAKYFAFSGLDSLYLGKDGSISRIIPSKCEQAVKTQAELISCIGVLIYQALDFGLGEHEEHALHKDLENLIEFMTAESHDQEEGEEHDEGIEEEESSQCIGGITFQDVMQLCESHLPSQSHASSHYKAVCRALVTESIELTTFLEAVSTNKSKLRAPDVDEHVECEEIQLEQLQRADWARLWMQVMRELRSGKALKKVYREHHASYELTPYEAMMKDIKDKKYQLRQVMVNGDIPPRTKKNAHDMILEFIRSRPPLHPVRERKCQRKPEESKSGNSHEQLMESIRAEPKLKPTPTHSRHRPESSRTRLDVGLEGEDESIVVPVKRVIKPDASLKLPNFSDDDSSSSDVSSDEDPMEDRNRVEAGAFSPITPLSPSHSPVPLINTPSQWSHTVLHTRPRPLARSNTVSGPRPLIARRSSFNTSTTTSRDQPKTSTPNPSPSIRNYRNSIMVCESPVYGKASPILAPKNMESPNAPTTTQQSRLYPRALKRTNSTIDITGRPRIVPRLVKRSPSCVDSRSRRASVSREEDQENKAPEKDANSLERLSLTLEEVMHIRNVLTKAELESLLVRPDLHDLVAKGKVCFTCLKTKFSLFGSWATTCKMCKRNVCSKCVSKMNIPAERFESIPVYTLSPSNLKNSKSKDDILVYDRTGSAPNSPDSERKMNGHENVGSKLRRKVARSATVRQSPSTTRPTSAVHLKGTEMDLCRDCQAMIVNIIKSSRASMGASALCNALGMHPGSSSHPCSPLRSPASSVSSPGSAHAQVNGRSLSLERSASDCYARPPSRNFRLDLKPVYKDK